MRDLKAVSLKGRPTMVPSIALCGVHLLFEGRFIVSAHIFDEYWLERRLLPPPTTLIDALRRLADRPDLFVFEQRIPDDQPLYDHFYEWNNYAVLKLTTYDEWFQKQIPSSTRRAVRESGNRGLVVTPTRYDDDYVRGIVSIYNETPIRAGRRFWHFGKTFDAVKRENGTYTERSTYLAAHCRGEIVGYLKMVMDGDTAAIMQVLSKTSCGAYRPNNALIAEAVRICCDRHVRYLLYENFEYGKKREDSLTRFKSGNGFIRMNVPRYYVPLTSIGTVALRMGLHKALSTHVPEPIAARLRRVRAALCERLVRGMRDGNATV